MAYAKTGLGESASASLDLRKGGNARAPKPPSTCATAARKKTADFLCQTVHLDCQVSALPICCITPERRALAEKNCRILPFGVNAVACAQAKKPICGPPGGVPPAHANELVTAITHPGVQAPAPPVAPGPPPPKAPTPVRPTKVPVPVAAPVPVAVLAPPEEEAGIPTWAWIAGGVAVLGTGAFLYSRRKGA